jgi:TetR/AcrR family transcriptional regulator, lmrAB and yxaGH operons repressor
MLKYCLEPSSDDLFRDRIKQALSRWIEAIALVLVESGLDAHLAKRRAEDAVLRIQGALVGHAL